MKFLKENWKMLVIVLIVAVLFPIIVLTPSRCGTISYDTGLTIVGYGGSILGGFLTLYGVWWTIKEQKQDLINQQKKLDDQRREDLAIQYKPIIGIECGTEKILKSVEKDFNKAKLDFFFKTPLSAIIEFAQSKIENTNLLISTIPIFNHGDGECYIKFLSDAIITNPEFKSITSYTKHDIYEKLHVKNGFQLAIPRRSCIEILVIIVVDSEYSNNDNQVTINAKLSVSDQFNYNKTDYLMDLTYSIDLKNNIFSNSIASITKI